MISAAYLELVCHCEGPLTEHVCFNFAQSMCERVGIFFCIMWEMSALLWVCGLLFIRVQFDLSAVFPPQTFAVSCCWFHSCAHLWFHSTATVVVSYGPGWSMQCGDTRCQHTVKAWVTAVHDACSSKWLDPLFPSFFGPFVLIRTTCPVNRIVQEQILV